MSKIRETDNNIEIEPQVENFVPERYTLVGVTDSRLAWISRTARDARELYQIQGVGVDCVQLGIWLNNNTMFKIEIKTVDIPIHTDANTIYVTGMDKYLIGLNRNKLRYPFQSSANYRANFTIAHELGHILIGHASIANACKDKDLWGEEEIEAC